MIFTKEFDSFIDGLDLSSKIKSKIKSHTLNLLTTEKINSKRNPDEIAEYILDMFDRYPDVDRNMRKQYVMYCLSLMESKC